MTTSFPFPFIGAGDAQYFEWSEVHIVFEREPTKVERKAIKKRVPPPLTDTVDFEGRHLMAASDQFAHAWIIEHYEKSDDDETDDDVSGGFPFAADSRVAAFNADIEAWLQFAHSQCPIVVAYRGQDWEAGGTNLSTWHDWSVAQAVSFLEQFDEDLDLEDDPLGFVLVGILDEVTQAGGEVPERFRAE